MNRRGFLTAFSGAALAAGATAIAGAAFAAISGEAKKPDDLIVVGSVVANKLAAPTITAGRIAPSAFTAESDMINYGSVEATSIRASKLGLSDLSTVGLSPGRIKRNRQLASTTRLVVTR